MRADRIGLGLGALLALSACIEAPTRTGRADYVDYCAGCHGETGTGNGPAAASLEAMPADLTQIAAGNGGTFPMVPVMAKIDGYAKGEEAHSGMPAFWPLLEGKTVLIETEPGVVTPTPERLVNLARYLESIQE